MCAAGYSIPQSLQAQLGLPCGFPKGSKAERGKMCEEGCFPANSVFPGACVHAPRLQKRRTCSASRTPLLGAGLTLIPSRRLKQGGRV